MRKFILFLTGLVLIFTSCKKENKSSPSAQNDPGVNNSSADFTITQSNINYPVGSTWVYEVVTVDVYYTNGITYPNQSYTTTATYTVTVSRDTLISGSITGKIMRYEALGLDGVNSYIRGVTYFDPTDIKWHEIVYQKYNGGPESSGCLGIDLPLTSSGKWQSAHGSHMSAANDSCYARGFETISCGLGNVKCIRFDNHDGSTLFWYNKVYGRVRTQNFSFEIINSSQVISKLNTTSLISFHQ